MKRPNGFTPLEISNINIESKSIPVSRLPTVNLPRITKRSSLRDDLPLTGFTIIEMFVVIAVILILGSIIATGFINFKAKAKVNNTELLIERLKGSLTRYYEKFLDYPPSEGEWEGSQNIYYCLGQKIEFTTNRDPKTGEGRTELYGPIERFNVQEMDGEKYIVDAWNNQLYYKEPGTHLYTKDSYDLASWGPNGEEDEPDSPENDDIANWKIEE